MSTINPFSWSRVGVSIINAVAFSFSRCCLVWLINSNEVISDYLILLEQKFFFLGHLSFIRKKTHTAVTKFWNKLKFQAVKNLIDTKKIKTTSDYSFKCLSSQYFASCYIYLESQLSQKMLERRIASTRFRVILIRPWLYV